MEDLIGADDTVECENAPLLDGGSAYCTAVDGAWVYGFAYPPPG